MERACFDQSFSKHTLSFCSSFLLSYRIIALFFLSSLRAGADSYLVEELVLSGLFLSVLLKKLVPSLITPLNYGFPKKQISLPRSYHFSQAACLLFALLLQPLPLVQQPSHQYPVFLNHNQD